MAENSKPKPAAKPRRGGRGTVAAALLGMLVGLVLGLAIAVVVAVYVTKAPVPFVNKTSRANERLEPPAKGAELPDPNKPLAGKTRVPTAPEPAMSDTASILSIFRDAPPVPERNAAPPVVVAPAPAPSPAPSRAPEPARGGESPAYPSSSNAGDDAGAASAAATPAPAAAEAPKAASSFVLQAGAFRGQDEADAMKAKLALIGLEARVLPADVEGKPMYRVRVGPYAQLEDMNRARSRLAESGIESTVVRQR